MARFQAARRCRQRRVRGTGMTRKLNEADRAAVDMLFDRIRSADGKTGNGNGGSEAVVMMTAPVSDERISAVERVLLTLEEMPAPEPSADLVVRTLQRIARQSATGVAAPLPTAPFIDPTQPMA